MAENGLLLAESARFDFASQAVTRHFKDIGHDPAVHDEVFENAQVGERTQILMDWANKHGAIAVGTGGGNGCCGTGLRKDFDNHAHCDGAS